MRTIFKCIMVFLLECNIYQFLGYGMSRLRWLPERKSFLQTSIFGFLGYHALFWCVAFPCTLFNISLDSLTVIWLVLLCALLFIITGFHFRGLAKTYQDAAAAAWKYRAFLIPCLTMGFLLVYYVCTNGLPDIDAQTYIGEVTSMVDTGKLTGIWVKNGVETQFIALRRSFAIFGVNSAVLCKIFQIHPLIFCRTVRASINVVLFGAAVFEMFRHVYRRQENSMEHSFMSAMLAMAMFFAFANTIYTEARFMLMRAYEGKAYCASTLMLITILIAIQLCTTMDKRFFVLFFLDMLAGMSISASATFILPLAGGSIILACALVQRRWAYIPVLLVAASPNILYLLLKFSGFSGFHLEG